MKKNLALITFLGLIVTPILSGCVNDESSTTSVSNRIQLTLDNYLYYLSARKETKSDTYSSTTTTYFTGSTSYLYINCVLYYTSKNADTTKSDFKYDEIHLSVSGVGQYESRFYWSSLSATIEIENVIKKVSGFVERI